jgi:hypothetical protein
MHDKPDWVRILTKYFLLGLYEKVMCKIYLDNVFAKVTLVENIP